MKAMFVYGMGGFVAILAGLAAVFNLGWSAALWVGAAVSIGSAGFVMYDMLNGSGRMGFGLAVAVLLAAMLWILVDAGVIWMLWVFAIPGWLILGVAATVLGLYIYVLSNGL